MTVGAALNHAPAPGFDLLDQGAVVFVEEFFFLAIAGVSLCSFEIAHSQNGPLLLIIIV